MNDSCTTQDIVIDKNKCIPMPMPQTSPTKRTKDLASEYSLKYNFFDPSKSSPPNDFMLKLQLRMTLYESLQKDANFTKK